VGSVHPSRPRFFFFVSLHTRLILYIYVHRRCTISIPYNHESSTLNQYVSVEVLGGVIAQGVRILAVIVLLAAVAGGGEGLAARRRLGEPPRCRHVNEGGKGRIEVEEEGVDVQLAGSSPASPEQGALCCAAPALASGSQPP